MFSSRHRLFLSSLLKLFILAIYILLAGDVELNPGPGRRETTLSVCHWNLNSVWVDDFVKINQLSAFLNTYTFDILCLGETFLNSEIKDDDPRGPPSDLKIHAITPNISQFHAITLEKFDFHDHA